MGDWLWIASKLSPVVSKEYQWNCSKRKHIFTEMLKKTLQTNILQQVWLYVLEKLKLDEVIYYVKISTYAYL